MREGLRLFSKTIRQRKDGAVTRIKHSIQCLAQAQSLAPIHSLDWVWLPDLPSGWRPAGRERCRPVLASDLGAIEYYMGGGHQHQGL
jgi:hypothetical protein